MRAARSAPKPTYERAVARRKKNKKRDAGGPHGADAEGRVVHVVVVGDVDGPRAEAAVVRVAVVVVVAVGAVGAVVAAVVVVEVGRVEAVVGVVGVAALRVVVGLVLLVVRVEGPVAVGEARVALVERRHGAVVAAEALVDARVGQAEGVAERVADADDEGRALRARRGGRRAVRERARAAWAAKG